MRGYNDRDGLGRLVNACLNPDLLESLAELNVYIPWRCLCCPKPSALRQVPPTIGRRDGSSQSAARINL